MLEMRLRDTRFALLSPRSGAQAAVKSATSFASKRRFLARGAAAGFGLAPLARPVPPKRPWFGVGFHGAQLSSVYGVLLYPTLDGLARHAWLGPRTAARAKLTNTN